MEGHVARCLPSAIICQVFFPYLPSAGVCRVFFSIIAECKNVCRVFSSKTLGKQRVCRVSESLLSVFSLALGKEMVCRVSDKIHSANPQALDNLTVSGSFIRTRLTAWLVATGRMSAHETLLSPHLLCTVSRMLSMSCSALWFRPLFCGSTCCSLPGSVLCKERRVAPLREAVVEEDAQEARGDLHVLPARGLHGGAHNAMQVRARQRVEVRGQAPRRRVVLVHRRRRLQIRQRQQRPCCGGCCCCCCRPCCGCAQQDEHGQEDMDVA